MDDADFDADHIPYWTELWPASLALASWLEMRQDDIRTGLCLDLGCGLGLTAIIASWLGARVCAIDNDEGALTHASLNAKENDTPPPAWILMDWRKPAFRRGIFRRVWAGDILYEKRFMEPVAGFLDWSLMEGGAAWIAEPGRKIFEVFLGEMKKRKWSCARVYSLPTKAVIPQASPVRSAIWEIARKR